MIPRRRFLTLSTLGLASWSLPSHAQTKSKRALVAVMHPGFPESGATLLEPLRLGLRDAGFNEGVSVEVTVRWGRGKPEAIAPSVAELLSLQPDVLVATARPTILQALAQTKTVPIVANDLESDPVASGFAASLMRPGGNLTGVFLDAPGLCAAWLQRLGDVVPDLKSVATLWDTTTGPYQRDATINAAKARSVALAVFEYTGIDTIEPALDRALAANPQAIIVLGSPIARYAAANLGGKLLNRRVAGISQFRDFAVGGGLMSYGPDLFALYRRQGTLVAKILNGAPPADLPIERPTKFEFVINAKTSTAFNVTIPDRLLAQADEVLD